MFGYITASWKELSKQEQERYGAVYCGICRRIRCQSSQAARLGLSYDMAFLALLLMSLYEPEESGGKNACWLHPVTKRPWIDNRYVRYAADMNVALAYYNCLDDWQDDHKASSRLLAKLLGSRLEEVKERYPRQCEAIAQSVARLNQLEQENCPNPDEPAGVFGALMAQILTYQQDLWAPTLAQMGFALGRFIYLLDAAVDYDKDKRQGKYIGRKPMEHPDFNRVVSLWQSGQLTAVQAMKQLHMSKSTFYRHVRYDSSKKQAY